MSPKGAPLFEKLWEMSNPKKKDANGRTRSWMYRYFNPQHEGREDFVDEYGNSKWVEAKLFRKNEVDAAVEAKDHAQARKIKRQYPETIEECFDVIGGTYFNEDANQSLRYQRKEIEKLPVSKRELPYWVRNVGGAAVYNTYNGEKPKFFIKELPKDRVDYQMTIDGVATGTKFGAEEGSAVSAIMWKMYDHETLLPFETVGSYMWRPETVEQAFEDLLNFAKMYNLNGRFKKNAPRSIQLNTRITSSIYVKTRSNSLGTQKSRLV